MIYVCAVYQGGINPNLDRNIEKAAGSKRVGSGCFLLTGERDINFQFLSRSDAQEAAARIGAIDGVCVTIDDDGEQA